MLLATGSAKRWWLRVGCFVFVLILASMATPQQSRAAVIGTYVGTFSGNDSVLSIETIMGLSGLVEIGKVNNPDGTDGGLTTFGSTGPDNTTTPKIPQTGNWITTELTLFFAVKEGSTDCIVANGCATGDITGTSNTSTLNTSTTGDAFALYAYSGIGVLDDMYTGVQFFNANEFKMISHVAAYGVVAVPLPAALPLFLSALAGLGFFGWRRNRAAA